MAGQSPAARLLSIAKLYCIVREIMFGQFTAPCTRREARRISRREAILDVAQGSFMECGYAGTTMSGIAAMLGGSKATLWSYFPCKEVLFAAVVDRASDSVRENMSLILNPQDDIGVTLGRFAREFLRKVTSPRALALNRLVIGEVARFPETGRIFHERAVGRTHELLADYMAAVMERGLLRQAVPLVAAQQLLGLCSSGCHHKLLLGAIGTAEPSVIEDDAERAVATFLRAYAA